MYEGEEMVCTKIQVFLYVKSINRFRGVVLN